MTEVPSDRGSPSDEQWKAFADGWLPRAVNYLTKTRAEGRDLTPVEAWLLLALTELGKAREVTTRGEANHD